MTDKKKIKIFERIGKKWRESVDRVREYEIIDFEETTDWGFIQTHIFGFEYRKAQRLKQKLMEKYEGKNVEDVISGEEIETEKGRFYQVLNRNKVRFIKPDFTEVGENILSNLKLIYGIGDVTERVLKEEGYKTINDLKSHPRFGSEACNFLELFEICDTYRLMNWIGRWFSKSHPLVLCVSGLHQKEDFVFLDIETMGLFGRPIILFGIAKVSGEDILVHQYLLRDIREEAGALAKTISHFEGNIVLVTFNGRTFDIPFIKERLAYYGMRADIEKPNFDLLHFSRRAWREKLPNCRLTTVEKYLLGIERKDDVPSALVPEFYATYLRTGNPGPLIPILEHNKQDLISLAHIFSKLWEEWRWWR